MFAAAHSPPDDLKQGGDDCGGEPGKSPNQAEPKPAGQLSAAGGTSGTTPPASPNGTAVAAGPAGQIDISSTPSGADIEIDGRVVGSTPSSVTLAPGDHEIAVKKTGFTAWDRKLSV